nr:hypothetical protein [uncultured Anaerostipes sp.]
MVMEVSAACHKNEGSQARGYEVILPAGRCGKAHNTARLKE